MVAGRGSGGSGSGLAPIRYVDGNFPVAFYVYHLAVVEWVLEVDV
jgi:hypothetical protein